MELKAVNVTNTLECRTLTAARLLASLLLVFTHCIPHLTRRKKYPHLYLAGSPSSGVVDVIVAIGPFPVCVTALILKVYDVEGLSFDTAADVVLASETEISRVEPAPTTCTEYPVMTVLCSPSGKVFQEISAEVGSS